MSGVGGGGGGGGLPPPPPPQNITNITTLKLDFRDKDRFAGQEYDVWAMRMQAIFEEHELWDIVNGTTAQPAAGHADLPQWTKLDKRARSLILQGLDRTMIHHTQAAPTSHGVWSRLSTLYQAADSAHKMAAIRLFHTMTMKENDQVEKYVIQFRSVRARLASCGTTLSETEAAEAFLASLPPSYGAFVTTQYSLINQSKAAAKLQMGTELTLTDIISNLLAEEVCRDLHKRSGTAGGSTSRAVYSSRPKFRKPKKPFAGGESSSVPVQNHRKTKDPCNWCKIPGHFERECRKKQAGEPRRNALPETHLASKPSVLVTSSINITCGPQDWYVDSGASDHICHDQSLFTTWFPNTGSIRQPSQLTVGNNAVCKIEGSGKVVLKTSENKRLVLKEVLYVPTMAKHLVSVSRLLEVGKLDVKFRSDVCIISSKSTKQVLATARLCDRLYRLLLTNQVGSTINIALHAMQGHVSQMMLWHARLNHVHEKKLKMLSLHPELYCKPITGITDLEFCDSCARGKIKQLPYAKHLSYQAAKLLELVHTDLCGPISTASFGGALYFMPFVDHYSRMTHVYFLHKKSQALSKF